MLQFHRTKLAGALLCSISLPAAATTVDVRVSPVNSDAGKIQVQVCEKAEWLKDCVRLVEVPAHRGTVVVSVPNVPPGTYAVLAFHDANGNGKVDQNFIGIPREGVGFSRVASVPLGEPSFDGSALRIEGERVIVPIHLFFEP